VASRTGVWHDGARGGEEPLGVAGGQDHDAATPSLFGYCMGLLDG
jgi:hypothetical protein